MNNAGTPHSQGSPQPPVYGTPQGQPAYGQPAYVQPAYGQPAYGQPAYGQPAYGQPAYVSPHAMHAAPYVMAPPKKKRNLCPLILDWIILIFNVLNMLNLVSFIASIGSNSDGDSYPIALVAIGILDHLCTIFVMATFVRGELVEKNANMAKIASFAGMALAVAMGAVAMFLVHLPAEGQSSVIGGVVKNLIFFAVTGYISAKPKSGAADTLLPYPSQE